MSGVFSQEGKADLSAEILLWQMVNDTLTDVDWLLADSDSARWPLRLQKKLKDSHSKPVSPNFVRLLKLFFSVIRGGVEVFVFVSLKNPKISSDSAYASKWLAITSQILCSDVLSQTVCQKKVAMTSPRQIFALWSAIITSRQTHPISSAANSWITMYLVFGLIIHNACDFDTVAECCSRLNH